MNSLEPLKSLIADERMLVIGGLNVDQHLLVEKRPVDDGSARVNEYEFGFGGHAGNCAVQLARLGAGVSVLGAVGEDADGAALLADLEYCGIDVSLVSRQSPGHTGRVIIPTFPDCRYMLMYRGANDHLDPHLVNEVTGFDAVVLFDPPMAFAEALFEFLGHLTERPRVYWNPGGLLTNSPWISARMACADVVVMNRVETQAALGGPVNDRLLQGFEAGRPGFRLIETLGREGARLYAAGRTIEAASYPARVVDETGAGDAFTAGFAAFDALGLEEGLSLRLANVLGACAIEGLGARAALPDLDGAVNRWNLSTDVLTSIALRSASVPIGAY